MGMEEGEEMESLKLLPPHKGEQIRVKVAIRERIFKAKIRYLASSHIITIPARVCRDLGLRLGDMVIVEIKRKL